MIGYADMTWNDAPNYFGGCWAFHWNSGKRTVTPYIMRFDGGYEEDDMAYDCEIGLRNEDGHHRYVEGSYLWDGDEYITHRFAVEYVPVSDNVVIRVCLEPTSSRMCKGMTADYIRYLPVIGDDPSRFRTGQSYDTFDIMNGVAHVLQLGTPPVMRRRIPMEQAYARARADVREMMESVTRTVAVPEFKWAIIKHRAHTRWAYVIRSGRHVGYLRRAIAGTDLTFFGIRSALEDRKSRSLVNDGLRDAARNLICERVEWVMPGVNPINQSRYNVRTSHEGI